MRNVSKVARYVLAAAVIVYLAGFAMYYDYRIFTNWVYASRELGIHEIYCASRIFGPDYRVVYPPLAPTIFVASYTVYEKIANDVPLRLASYIERLTVKAPLIASLVALWALAARRLGERRAYWLVLLGPPLLTVIAVYNFDLYMVLLLALSIEALLAGFPAVAGLLLGLSVLSKQIAVLGAPMLLLAAYRIGGRHAALRLSLGAASAIVLAIPFTIVSPYDLLNSVLGFHGERPPQGPSIWYSMFVASGYHCSPALCSLWLILFAVLYALALIGAARDRVIDPYGYVALAFTAYLATGKVVNPVYLAWPYAFTVLSPRQSRRLLALYLAAFSIVLLYYGLLFFGSASSGLPVYLPEEQRWMSPDEVRFYIFNSLSTHPLLAALVARVLSLEPVRHLSHLILSSWVGVSLALSIAYTGLMVVTFLKLLGRT